MGWFNINPCHIIGDLFLRFAFFFITRVVFSNGGGVFEKGAIISRA